MDVVTIHCPKCRSEVPADVLATMKRCLPNADAGARLEETFTFARCPGCLGPLLASEGACYALDIGGESFELGGFLLRRLYPPPSPLDSSAPAPVMECLDEARRCLENSCFRAAVLLCRATLEGACKQLDTGDLKLAPALEFLAGAGAIDKRMLEWADTLRRHGNLAAHELVSEITWEDANDLVGFTEALLTDIFVIGARFKDFKRRHQSDGVE